MVPQNYLIISTRPDSKNIFIVPQIALGSADFAAYFAAWQHHPILVRLLNIVIEQPGL
jgi:hypothetical protein